MESRTGLQIPRLLQDDREILAAHVPNADEGWTVGYSGVTAIRVYGEAAEYSFVPWLAVYKGDDIIARAAAGSFIITYK